MKKITLRTAPINGGSFNCFPAMAFEIEPERVLCNDVRLPWENQIGENVSLYVVTNEFGAMGAVWAANAQEALDELVDADLAAGIEITEENESPEDEEDENVTRLGNYGKPCDLTHCQVLRVAWDNSRDCQTLCLFAEARALSVVSLGDEKLTF